MHTNAFPGKARVAAFADVIHARIKSESVSTNGRKSRDFKIEILSLSLSLSPKRKRNAETLSLSFPLSNQSLPSAE